MPEHHVRWVSLLLAGFVLAGCSAPTPPPTDSLIQETPAAVGPVVFGATYNLTAVRHVPPADLDGSIYGLTMRKHNCVFFVAQDRSNDAGYHILRGNFTVEWADAAQTIGAYIRAEDDLVSQTNGTSPLHVDFGSINVTNVRPFSVSMRLASTTQNVTSPVRFAISFLYEGGEVKDMGPAGCNW